MGPDPLTGMTARAAGDHGPGGQGTMSRCCILMVKDPRPEHVKTRLMPHCSAEEAALLYGAFVLDSVAVLAESSADLKVVACAPAEAEPKVREWLEGRGDFAWLPQPEGDLGQRLDQLMGWSFDQGAGRTAIIGSDTPSLPPAYIDMALDAMVENEVVVGPSVDGGYYLIGQQAGERPMFAGVEWSTGRVLEQTLSRLGGRSLGLLPPWYDVDTAPDAGFLKVHLMALHRAGQPRGSHSLRVLRRMKLPPPS